MCVHTLVCVCECVGVRVNEHPQERTVCPYESGSATDESRDLRPLAHHLIRCTICINRYKPPCWSVNPTEGIQTKNTHRHTDRPVQFYIQVVVH